MFQDTVASWTSRGGGAVRASDAPEVAVRLVGSLLAVAIAAVHVADQGGVTSLASPAWIGWSYRLIEVGAVLTALSLLVARPPWLGWAAGVLLGVGPFIAYITSRTVGLPGDTGDVGNWGYWIGTVSLVVEAALVVLSIGMLLAWRQRMKAVAAGAGSSRAGARVALGDSVTFRDWGQTRRLRPEPGRGTPARRTGRSRLDPGRPSHR